MTDLRQAAQQALEALGSGNPYHQQLAAKVLRAALEQQAEPVADEAIHAAWSAGFVEGEKAALEQQAEPVAKLFGSLPVYDTTPPQRKELSASEILNMMPSAIPAEYDGELMEFARAVEAKLKEKNNG